MAVPFSSPTTSISEAESEDKMEVVEQQKLAAKKAPPAPDLLALQQQNNNTNDDSDVEKIEAPAAAATAPTPKPVHCLLAILNTKKQLVRTISCDENKHGNQWLHLWNLDALGANIFHNSIANKATTKKLFKDIRAKKCQGVKGWTKPFTVKALFEIAMLINKSKKAEKDGDVHKGTNCTAKHNKKKPKEHQHVTQFKAYQ